MQTSVVGFPRIGAERELKFASEKYFKGEIDANELKAVAKDLRERHVDIQHAAGIDFIPSNDFSFYDGLLDAACLCGIIPERYTELELSELDTYFAMARGYQGEKGDVKALAMKKWFHTNYHYIVPELEDKTVIGLHGTKPFEEYDEAKERGVETKPVLTGAYTLLELCRYTGTKTREDYLDDIAKVYVEVISRFEERGTKWLQFNEPSIVMDLDNADKAFFVELYKKILAKKGNVKILIQTFFGDVRDIYEDLIEMPFDGIGLDFIEGKQTESLIEKYGFPEEKILFAGLINGKNIWKNDYEKTLQFLKALKGKGTRVVLSTSCSLQHVPYNLTAETGLAEEYKKHFAFAEEKLVELKEIGKLAEADDPEKETEYRENRSLFAIERDCADEEVQKRLSEVKELPV